MTRNAHLIAFGAWRQATGGTYSEWLALSPTKRQPWLDHEQEVLAKMAQFKLRKGFARCNLDS